MVISFDRDFAVQRDPVSAASSDKNGKKLCEKVNRAGSAPRTYNIHQRENDHG